MLAMKKTLVQELEKLSVVSGAEVSCCFSCCLFSPGWHDRAKFSFVFLERYQEQALFSLLWGTPERGVHQVPFRFGHRLSVISHFLSLQREAWNSARRVPFVEFLSCKSGLWRGAGLISGPAPLFRMGTGQTRAGHSCGCTDFKETKA